MNALFGIPMSTIMWVLVALFAVCAATVLSIALTNRVMFRLGLRNVARRRTQTGLMVVGLMLATLIITAAFGTGDSVDFSITKLTYDNLQRTDLSLHHFRTASAEAAGADVEAQSWVDERIVPSLQTAFANDPDIEGFFPILFESVPAFNPSTKLAEPVTILTGIDPALLSRYGGLTLADGGQADLAALGPDEAFINERFADKLEAHAGDTITIYSRDKEWPLRILGVVKNERASGVPDFGPGQIQPGLAVLLPTAQRITIHPGQINNVSVALKGDVRSSLERTDPAFDRLESFFNDRAKVRALGVGDFSVEVEKNKQDAVEIAKLIGNVFTTMFIVLGLFAIAAGIMLIFTIFVMLAAERKTEMGIARAVGARRTNLIQTFVAEGMVYDVLAGALGAALGVATAAWLIIGGTKIAFGGDVSEVLAAHITLRSLVVSYCLGVVLTFATVAFSSVRISRLNIVAAVRGIDEERRAREHKRRTNWLWVALGVPALIIPPLGLYWLLRKGFGLPWAWVVGPAGIAFGLLLMVAGEASGQYFPFSLGVSLLPLSVAPLARYYGAPNRLTWTAVGLALAVYWLSPQDWHAKLYGKLSGGMEMEVFSGLMIVIALTLVIVFNARLLNSLAEGTGEAGRGYRIPLALVGVAGLAVAAGLLMGGRVGGLGQLFYLLAALLLLGAGLAFAAVRYPWFAPALKMGVAYPLANRFRTGMTIAMFSLIIFALTIMSVMNASFMDLFNSSEARGGWDVSVSTNRNNPITDLRAALMAEGDDGARLAGQITDIGRLTPMQWYGAQEVRQTGQEEWVKYWVRAGDEDFYAKNEAKLEGRARGYDSDRAVFEAVRTTPNLAVLDALPTQPPNPMGMEPSNWRLKDVEIKDGAFDPFVIEIRDPITGQEGQVTVIGVFSARIPSNLLIGLFVNEPTYTAVYGRQEFRDMAVRLVPGADADRVAKGIKATLVTRGVQADSIQKRIDEVTAQSRGLMRIFQAFMALGLFVGIAALGVIAFRSVVERRQQIGMLRAIGYPRGTVALSFILESSFIASMGILSGVVGAVILSWNLLASSYFEGYGNVGFFIPWVEVVAFIVIAYGFALLMTWWPSRRAARVPIAEALRYE